MDYYDLLFICAIWVLASLEYSLNVKTDFYYLLFPGLGGLFYFCINVQQTSLKGVWAKFVLYHLNVSCLNLSFFSINQLTHLIYMIDFPEDKSPDILQHIVKLHSDLQTQLNFSLLE